LRERDGTGCGTAHGELGAEFFNIFRTSLFWTNFFFIVF
jgi:hypothetical protein